MNYELAKELKDAGFPGSEKWQEWTAENGMFFCQSGEPKLSELIAACEPTEKWVVLLHLTDKTQTAAKHGLTGEGTTPEEAVAHLWLALNKK